MRHARERGGDDVRSAVAARLREARGESRSLGGDDGNDSYRSGAADSKLDAYAGSDVAEE